MTSFRCDDWSGLEGVHVVIRRHGQPVRAGVVDAVMQDATILWLALDHNGNRALFESAEGYEVWADTDDVPDELYSAVHRQHPPTARFYEGEEDL